MLKARTVLLAVLVIAAFTFPAYAAQDHEDPELLIIEDASGTPVGEYTPDDLKSNFTIHDRVTQTPWTDDGEEIHYRGVFLKDILAQHGLDELQSVEVFADDDFLAVIGMDDIEDYSPLIAFELSCTDQDRTEAICSDDQEFRALELDDRGPYFLVWPYQDLPDHYVPSRNNLWVWWIIGIRPAQ